MTDQQFWGLIVMLQVSGCIDEVIDVGLERRIGETTFAFPNASEIETHNRDAVIT
jgi:hypothetical protein